MIRVFIKINDLFIIRVYIWYFLDPLIVLIVIYCAINYIVQFLFILLLINLPMLILWLLIYKCS
jgi:hypothetical protein